MSDIERARISKEAVDAVASRPPRDAEDASGSALRRYLGIAMFQTLRQRQDAARKRVPPRKAGNQRESEPKR
jgi:hypothetical protein